MDWSKYDALKVIGLLQQATEAKIWARRTFFAVLFGLGTLAFLIVLSRS